MSFWLKHGDDLDDELQSHLRMAAQDRIDRGAAPEEAHAAARREFGNVGLVHEVTRDVESWSGLRRFMQDLKHGVRVLRRNPTFATVSVLTLALGIGASTAIFSVVYGVLLRPLPYYKAEQIVRVAESNSKGLSMDFADPNFEDLRAQNDCLQGLAEYGDSVESVSGGAEPRRVTVAAVSRDFFRVMGVQPFRGRGFLPEDQRVHAAPVALVSYAYWRDSLGARENLSATEIRIDNHPGTVVGVLPPGFRFPDDADVWIPREIYEVLPARSAHNWEVVGRLKDGVTSDEARVQLSAIAQRIKQQYGDDVQMTAVSVTPLQQSLTGNVSSALLVLLGAVGFLLLVACANVMNLLLAQAAARRSELATRSALGASRGRLVRQFLAESLLICGIGGMLGVAAAVAGVPALKAVAPGNIPRLNEVGVNMPVLLFGFGLCCAIAVGLGVITAMRATSGDVQQALVEGNRRQAGSDGRRAGQLIIALQLGVTMVLLVGAGLLGRSLLRVLSVNPGFRTDQVVTMDLALPAIDVAARPGREQFISRLLDRLRSLPGVMEVGATSSLPLGDAGLTNGTFAVVNEQQLSQQNKDLIQRWAHATGDLPPQEFKSLMSFFQQLFQDPAQTGHADYCVGSEGYFQALGIPILSGRSFQDSDTEDAPHVAVISESLARQRWLGRDPIGQTIEFGNMDGDLRLLRVVGVVADVHNRSLEVPARPTVYVTYRQRPEKTGRFTVVLRASAAAAGTLPAAKKILAELDPTVAPKLNTFSQIFSSSLTSRRFNLILIGAFAFTALFLAVIGIYGVLSYAVARRTREMGVRIALGATKGSVLRLVLSNVVLTAAAGVGFGIVTALALTRSLQSQLFGISAVDPLTFAVISLFLLLVAVFAAYIPARRATRVDPMVALRYE